MKRDQVGRLTVATKLCPLCGKEILLDVAYDHGCQPRASRFERDMGMGSSAGYAATFTDGERFVRAEDY